MHILHMMLVSRPAPVTCTLGQEKMATAAHTSMSAPIMTMNSHTMKKPHASPAACMNTHCSEGGRPSHDIACINIHIKSRHAHGSRTGDLFGR